VSEPTPSPRYAYLHGFASGPQATKGVALADAFAAEDEQLVRPDLNQPSFAALTYSAALEALDRMHDDAGRPQWRLIGSSMGGYLAARWAELHPDRVERLLLLCPAFDLPGRWAEMFGDAFERWQDEGSMAMPDGAGTLTDVHFGLVEDARTHPKTPNPLHPTLVIHGRDDIVVPIGSSREWAEASDSRTLIEVDDGHPLHDSVDAIAEHATSFLIAAPPTTVLYWDHFGPSSIPTSEHFKRHLDEFLQREGLPGCTTGVISEGEGHGAAFCRSPAAHVDAIAGGLRPRRRR
jgi:pimeloyl-ACP methyl ester carboxylesterase